MYFLQWYSSIVLLPLFSRSALFSYDILAVTAKPNPEFTQEPIAENRESLLFPYDGKPFSFPDTLSGRGRERHLLCLSFVLCDGGDRYLTQIH